MARFPLYFYLILFSLLTFFVGNLPFFWDTTQLAGAHASYYYSSHFSTLLLPDYLDSGHPPLLGMYLAALWKLFGKNLWVAHLSMLPFLLGTVYQCYRLTGFLFDKKWLFLTMSFLLLDATLLGQASLVSPDNILLFFFFLCLNAVFRKDPLSILISCIGLSLVSMRGMGMAVALMFYYFALYYKDTTSFKSILKQAWPWVLGGSFGLAFLIYHYVEKGWNGYHENSPWAVCFQKVGIQGFLKNCVLLVWRMLDFGRLAIWICILAGTWMAYKKQILFQKGIKHSFLLFFIVLLFSCPSFLLYNILNAHRYLLPVYLCASLLAAQLTVRVLFIHVKSKAWLAVFFLMLLSGHFWVYPDAVSKGWDSSLAYLPYFGLRQKMIDYIKREDIPFDQVSTGAFNEQAFDYYDLSGDSSHFTLGGLDNEYVFYSNIYNNYSDRQLKELESRWIKKQEFKKGQVRVALYQYQNLKLSTE